MLSNPFEPKIMPAAETDPEKNKDLLKTLLGEKTAEEYGALVSGPSKAVRQPRPDLKSLAAAALASHPELLAISAEKNIEQFLTVELAAQFREQTQALLDIGFLEKKGGKIGVSGIPEGVLYKTSKFFELPTVEKVVAYFNAPEKKDFIKRKFGEGFTQILITPFAAPIETLIEKTGKVVGDHSDGKNPKKKILDRNGEALYVDQDTLVSVSSSLSGSDARESLAYGMLGAFGMMMSGKTKKELLNNKSQPFPGFRIQLIQGDLTIPRSGQGIVINGRPSIEAGKSPLQYLTLIQSDPIYKGERGFASEDWLTLFSVTLNKKNEVIDNWKDGVSSACYLIDAHHPGLVRMPDACWQQAEGHVDLQLSNLDNVNQALGCRTAVG